jgi:hypothetical protein
MAASMPPLQMIKTLLRSAAGQERRVARIDIAQQQPRGIGIGTGDEHGGDAQDVRGQAGGDQLLYKLARRDQHLAAQCPHFLAEDS